MYVILSLAFLFLFSFLALMTGMPLLFSAIGVVVFIPLAAIAYCFYRTRYVIEDGYLRSWSPFMAINLRLGDIKKVEQTRVPMHLRVGAGGYCGKFYIAGAGWTSAIISNFVDGLLITDKNGKHYLITPSNPDKFMKSLK
jgi:hypothetical protein